MISSSFFLVGVSDTALLEKQRQYFDWVSSASKDPIKALDFLSCLEKYDLAQKVLLEGVDDEAIKREFKRLQNSEIAGSG